jgi:transcriptional regulator with XRE-family HTH domain
MNILRLRKQNGLTQETLSKLTGISQGYISNIENGNHKANEITRQKIELVLGKVDWIETETIIVRDADYYKAERLLKNLVELSLNMERGQRIEFIKIVRKYFKR